jgi:hypothetical protein
MKNMMYSGLAGNLLGAASVVDSLTAARHCRGAMQNRHVVCTAAFQAQPRQYPLKTTTASVTNQSTDLFYHQAPRLELKPDLTSDLEQPQENRAY